MPSDSVVVIGAGGHAKVCIELLRAARFDVAFCVGEQEGSCLGVPAVAGDDQIEALYRAGHRFAFVAVGSNHLRARLAERVLTAGYQLVSAVSPHALVSPSARVGAGVAIMNGVVINADAVIDDLAIVNTGATIDHDCRIGFCSHVAPQSGLAGNVAVGARAFVGAGATLIPGVSVGDDTVVGAGSVVIADVPSGVVVVGVPARQRPEPTKETER